MRHGKKINHLGRKSAHRKAMLANMACSLIEHKRITTTLAKAKALQKYVEPIVTKSKSDSTHSRRVVFKYLQSKDAVTELFREVAPKITERPGGYTRIIKLAPRLGDNADMAFIELVDFNDLMQKDESASKSKTRRSRRGGGGKSTEGKTDTKKVSETKAEKSEEATDTIEDAKVEEVVETESEEPTAQTEVADKSEKTESNDETDTDEADSEEKKDA